MNASGALAIFVKTPGLSPLKTRLAEAIGAAGAGEFYQLAVAVVEETAESALRRHQRLSVYWAVAEAAGLPRWPRFPAICQGTGGLGARMAHVYRTLRRTHSFAILIGSDIPTLHAGVLDRAVRLLADPGSPRLVLGPAGDGGFYLIGGNIDIPRSAWCSIPYSVSDTCETFRRKLSTLGRVELLEVLDDVDTAADLAALRSALAARPARGGALGALSAWLSRTQLA